MGKDLSYSLVVSLILTSIFIAFWFGLFEFFLQLTRSYLSEKRDYVLSRVGINLKSNPVNHNFLDRLIIWLTHHRLKKCFFLCALPIPLLTEGTILAIKVTQTSKRWLLTKEFWAVQAANALKVWVTVMVIYRFF